MTPGDDLSSLISTRAKMILLRYLVQNDVEMSEREIAKLAGLSHMTVSRLLKEFEAGQLATWRRIGNAHVWKVNRQSRAFEFVRSFINQLERQGNAAEALITEVLKDMPKQGVDRVILFGSFADGTADETSDVDIFVEVRNQALKKEIAAHFEKRAAKILKRYGKLISPYILTSEEFRKPRNKNLTENIEKGKLLYKRKAGGID